MTVVTAVIAAYNEEGRISGAIQSLLKQSLRDIEILVVDDGSTDRTAEVVRAFDDPRIRCVDFGRQGYAGALKSGCEVAKGRFIAILDADDEAYPERLEKQAALLDQNPKIAWVGGGEERVDTRRGEHADRIYPSADTDIRRMAAQCIPYCHSSVMFRRALIEEGLAYNPAQPFLIDFELFLRIAERHDVANIPEVVVKRRLRGDSFFQSTYSARRQNRALARMSLSAVRRFRLPPQYAFYPIARLAYVWLPDGVKRRVRRLLGLREGYRRQSGTNAE